MLCDAVRGIWSSSCTLRIQLPQPQLRAKRSRRSGTLRGQRTCQKEAEEGRKLLSILKSPLGQHRDITHFRQLLCPDPLCEVCNTTTTNISRLLSRASLEDAAHTVSHLSAITSVTKSSLTQTSVISAEHPIPASFTEHTLPQSSTLPAFQVIPLADPLSPLAQDDSVPQEPSPPLDSRIPVDQLPSEPLATASCPPHRTQEKETVLQLEAPPSLDGSGVLSTDDLSLAEASFGEHSTASQVKPGSPKSPRSVHPALLERDIKKRDDFLMCSEREKGAEYFARRHESGYSLTTTGKRPELAADQQHSALSHPPSSSEGKPEELHMSHKLAGPKNLEDHVDPKCSQICPLPGLLRQSLSPFVHTSRDCLSAISNIFKAPESPGLPHTPLLSWPEVQPLPSSHTLPQAQAHHHHLVQAQGQLLSITAVLPDPALTQNTTGEVCFQSTQSEAQSLTLSEVRNLDYNMLQKVQSSVWGLPSVVQKYQEDIGPPVHKLLLVTESPKDQVPISGLPKESLNSEMRKKLEHHLHRNVIQYQQGLFPKALKSPPAAGPQTQYPVTSESKGSHGINAVSLLKGQTSKDLKSFDLSQASFHERFREMPPLKKGVGKRQSPETGDPHGVPQCVLGSDSDTDLKSHLKRLTGKTSQASCMSLRKKQLITALEVHLGKKFEEISKGCIPDIVHRSRYSTNLTLYLPEKSPKQVKDRRLAPFEGKDSYPNISQNISFLSNKKQKILEDHIKTFHNGIRWGLPHKVQKSTEIFTRKALPQAPSDSHILSSDNSVSGVHPKIEVCKPHRESPSAQNMTTPNSVLDHPCPAPSPVDKKGQGTLRRSPSSTSQELTEDRTQIFSTPRDHIDKASQQTLQAKRSPTPPPRLAVVGPEIRQKRMSSGSVIERHQSKMTMKLEHLPVCDKPRRTFKAQELHVRQSQPRTVLMSSKSEHVPVRDVSPRKPETSLTTKRAPRRTAVPQDLKSSGFKTQQLREPTCEMESVEQSQAQSLPTNVSLASNDFSLKTLFRHDKGAPCEGMVTSLKGQPPPENIFKRKIKYFFQWLYSSMKHIGQESSKGKTGASSSCVQGRRPGRGRAGLPGNSRDWKVSRVFARFFHQNSEGERFLPCK
ncbi:PREDICTED: putative spermatogenesis-associated protein 31D4 isoform X2 [Chinchilla lanigera]|uniref:putative spermatogenesis-associated protein 31D4 isoform X2 n=1 Tax=Chinchilla lanigera TaxID=34839 RepID=UPI00038F12C2|nr:PREDICTED: putative spermatogenesis-associated protein 31D4 isoform X2 [Chinchilla lanigera]